MHHFFVTPGQITGDQITITSQDVNHIRNVLRMKPGETIGIRDGISRNYICRIEAITADRVLAAVITAETDSTELPARLYLFQGLPKSDKMELIIQKAVELGVYQIIPVATKRAVVKLDAKKAEAKVRRWNTIAESAAKQCGRMAVPEVSGVMTFQEACSYAAAFDRNLMPYELAEGMADTRAVLADLKAGMKIGIFIGPEGGFDAAEAELAEAAGMKTITLGRRILRTETAGLAVLSILMFQLEEG